MFVYSQKSCDRSSFCEVGIGGIYTTPRMILVDGRIILMNSCSTLELVVIS